MYYQMHAFHLIYRMDDEIYIDDINQMHLNLSENMWIYKKNQRYKPISRLKFLKMCGQNASILSNSCDRKI